MFASNSFVMWEDRIVGFFLATIALVHFGRALTAPTASMRLRILGLSLGFAVLVRVIGLSTVCREEQQPYCSVTFYSGSAAPPTWAVYAITVIAWGVLPRIIAEAFHWSKSYAGPAPVFLAAVWRIIIVVNSLYWVFDWMETWDGLNADRVPLVSFIKIWAARASLGATLGALPYIWGTSGLCIKVVRETDQTGTREDEVEVYGFGNAYGSTYLLFVLIGIALVHLVSAPVAQIVIVGIITAVLAHLELVDTQRDAILMARSFANSATPGAFEPGQGDALVRPTFTDVVPLVLLGLLAFFATGHQAVLASIQWKAAFVGFRTVTYPWSPLLVIINTWGPLALAALCVPLLALWNVSPKPNGATPVLAHTVQAALAFIIYLTGITLASAVTAAWLRRHLMVWKVFAPRFMLAGVSLVVVDLVLILAVAVGVKMTSYKVERTFKCVSI
jgi:phosphatidylinositol glycan class O